MYQHYCLYDIKVIGLASAKRELCAEISNRVRNSVDEAEERNTQQASSAFHFRPLHIHETVA